MDMFPHTGDIHNGVSGHVECVCQLVKQSMDNDKQKSHSKKENLENVKPKIEVRKMINNLSES